VNFTTAHWKDAENFGYRFGAYIKDGRIESLAGAIRWSENSAAWEVGAVQTREDAQRKGYGKQIVSFITKYILDSGKYATCNTQENNLAMQKTAVSVGFFRKDE
jgi:GNAT superfamily N-acetyltransferase